MGPLSDQDLQGAIKRFNITPQGQQTKGVPNIDTPGAGENLFKFLTQNLPMAAVGTVAGGPIMGGALGMFPPQDLTSALTSGLGPGEAHVAGMIEKALPESAGWLGKMLTRGAVGYGQAKGDEEIRKLLGEGQVGGKAGELASAGLPMVLGAAADNVGKKVAAQAHTYNIEQAIGRHLGPELQDVNPPSMVRPTLQQIQEDFAQKQGKLQAAQAALQAGGKQLKNLDQQRNQLLTSVQYTEPEYSIYRQALLAKNDADRDKFLKLTGVPPEDMPEANVRAGLISDIQKQLNQVNQGINPYDPTQKLSIGEQQALKQNFENSIDEHKFNIWQTQENELREASEQNVQNNGLYDTTNAGVQQLQKTLDGLRQEIADNPFENQRLKNLVVGRDGSPASAQDFIKNLEDSSAEHITALWKYLGQQPKGEKQIQAVRDSMVASMFAQAYDPKTKDVTNLSKLIAPGAPYNSDKLEAIFGGGQQGTQSVKDIGTFIKDVQALGAIKSGKQTSSMIPNPFSIKGIGFAALPTVAAFSLGMPYHAAVGVGEGTAIAAKAATIGWSKLTDAIVNNPAVAAGFHNWVMKGGTQDALKATPALAAWLDRNSMKK